MNIRNTLHKHLILAAAAFAIATISVTYQSALAATPVKPYVSIKQSRWQQKSVIKLQNGVSNDAELLRIDVVSGARTLDLNNLRLHVRASETLSFTDVKIKSSQGTVFMGPGINPEIGLGGLEKIYTFIDSVYLKPNSSIKLIVTADVSGTGNILAEAEAIRVAEIDKGVVMKKYQQIFYATNMRTVVDKRK